MALVTTMPELPRSLQYGKYMAGQLVVIEATLALAIDLRALPWVQRVVDASN
jgi:hypothetical protein